MTSNAKDNVIPVSVLLDRLISASVSSDAEDSLSCLLSSVRRPGKDGLDNARLVAETPGALAALCSLIGTGRLPRLGLEVEGGSAGSCELIQAMIDGALASASSAASASASYSSSATAESAAGSGRATALIKSLLDPPPPPHSGRGGVDDPPRLVDSLLDLLCPVANADADSGAAAARPHSSAYARILSVRLLRTLTTRAPSLTQSMLLRAPDGLNRIVDLLDPSAGIVGAGGNNDNNSNMGGEDDSVRNEAILLATDLARASGSAARLIIFSEGYDRALGIAVDAERGLGGGSGSAAVVADCVRLCLELTRNDGMGAEVLLGSSGLLEKLAGLLDLRQARRFRHPDAEDDVDVSGGGREHDDDDNDDDEDDLDYILKGTAAAGNSAASSTQMSPPSIMVPYLTDGESEVVSLTVDLLDALLTVEDDGADETVAKAKRRKRQLRLATHDKLSRLLLDLALFAHPPPGARYVCGAPTASVQCRALAVLSNLGRDAGEQVLNELSGKRGVYLPVVGLMERVMYLVCTGGGPYASPLHKARAGGKKKAAAARGNPFAERMDVSAHALSVLRETLTAEAASLAVLHTLAPPINAEDVGPGGETLPPPPPTEVRKLVNTLSGNLRFLAGLATTEPSAEAEGAVVVVGGRKTPKEERDEREGRERCVVATVGAAGALGVFLTNGAGETTREMLLRVPAMAPLPPPPQQQQQKQQQAPAGETNLMECALHYLETTASSDASHPGYDPAVAMATLRLLSEWVPGAQPVVYALLANPGSVALGMMLQSPPTGPSSLARGSGSDEAEAAKAAKAGRKTVQALTALLLGLCMENLGPEDEVGGWSRSGLMGLVSAGIGIGKFTQALESLRKESGADAPWSRSKHESESFMSWCSECVKIVRKRAVQELTSSAGSMDGDSDSEGGGDVPATAADGDGEADPKSMAKLLSRQTSELDSLRSQLEEAHRTVAAQATQLKGLRRRMESNPTDLDRMLDDSAQRIRELEEENAELKKEIKEKDVQLEKMQTAKVKEVEQAREETRQAREDAREVAEERDSLQSELEGLSSAYASLEGEYNRILSSGGEGNNAQTETAAPTGEGDGSSGRGVARRTQAAADQTAEGQVRQPSSDAGAEEAPEVAAQLQSLRSENSKLRKDIRAANDWMKQAVQRIEGLTTDNQQLQEQAESLKAALDAASESENDGSSSPNKSAVERLASVEEQLSLSQSECASLRAELESARLNLARAREELSQSQEEVRSLQIAQTDREVDSVAKHQILTKLQGERDMIVREKEDETARLKEHHSTILSDLRGKFETDLEAKDNELKILNEEVKAMREEATRMQGELDLATKQREDVLVQKDGVVSGLEDRLKRAEMELEEYRRGKEADFGEAQAVAAAKIHAAEQSASQLRLEVSNLKSKLKDAQNWMKNAVQHHQNLNREVEGLKQRNQALSQEVDSLKRQNQQLSAEVHAATDLDRGAIEAIEKRRELEAKLEGLENTLAAERSAAETLRRQKEAIEEDAKEQIQRYGARVESLEEQLSSSEKTLSELGEIREQLRVREREVEEMSTLHQRLEAKEEEIRDLTKRHSEKEDEASGLASQIKSLNEERLLLQNELETVRENFATQAESQEAEIKRLESEVVHLKDAHTTLENERDQGLSMIGQLRGRLSEFQTWSQSAQRRVTEMEKERYVLEKKVADLAKAEESARKDAEAARYDLNTERVEAKKNMDALVKETRDGEELMKKEMEKLRAELSRLEMDNQNLGNRSSATAENIRVLEEHNSKSSSRIAELTSRLAHFEELEKASEDLRAQVGKLMVELEEKDRRSTELGVQLLEKESALTDAEGDLAMVSRELEDLRDQSEDAVKQWQARTEELESKVTELEEHIEALQSQSQLRESEATEAISQWEERCAQMEKSLFEMGTVEASDGEALKLREELTLLRSGMEEKEQQMSKLEEQLFDKESALADAEGDLTALTKDLDEMRDQSEAAISQWQVRTEELEAKISELESDIEVLQSRMQEQDSVATEAISKWEERCVQLEKDLLEYTEKDGNVESRLTPLQKRIDYLEKQLEQKTSSSDEDTERISNCTMVAIDQEDRLEVESKHKRETEEANVSIESLQKKIQDQENAVVDFEQQVGELTNELLETRQKTEEVVTQWKERSEQLEATVSDLEAAIEAQQAEANSVIEQWEERCNSLSEQVTELEKHVEESGWEGEKVIALTRDIEAYKESDKKMKDAQSKLEQEVEEANIFIARQKEVIESMQHKAKEKDGAVSSLEEKLENMTNELLETRQPSEECNVSSSKQKEVIESLQKEAQERDKIVDALEQQVEALTNELLETRQQSEEVVAQWKERSEQLEANVSELEATIEAQQAEADSVIEQWEERCNNLSEQVGDLEKQIEESGWDGEKVIALTRGIEACKDSEERAKCDYDTALTQLQSMKGELIDTKQQLQMAIAEKKTIETKHERTLYEAATKMAEKDSEIARMQELIDEWKGRSEHLESIVSEFNAQVEELKSQGVKNVDDGERIVALSKLVEEYKESTNNKGKALDEANSKIENIQLKLSKVESKLNEISKEKDQMEVAMKMQVGEANSTVAAKNEELGAINARVAELSQTLEKEREMMGNAMRERQMIERDNAKLKEELASAKKTMSELEVGTHEMKTQLSSERSKWEKELELLSVRLSSEQFDELQQSKMELEDAIQREKRQSDEVSRSLENERRTCAELKSHMRELEEELSEANEALQSIITDDAATRAAEMATEAIKAQLDELRAELNETNEIFENERHNRLVAEDENRRLRLALSQGVPNEFVDSHIKNLFLKGTERSLKLEIREVEELRKSLDKVVEELDSARAGAREAEERAAGFKLQASLAEKEVQGLKSDLALVRQTLEELRSAEARTRDSLEYRIAALEDDREVLSQSHADEVDSLKSELERVTMEKERVSHALAESEKANAALAYATTAHVDHGDGSATELAQLRLERAQLLAAATEVGARTERRIREAVAASAASIEAELILERELRFAAEALAEDVQVETTRSKAGARAIPKKDKKESDKIMELGEQIRQLKADITKVKAENRDLRNKLEKSEADAKAAVTRLTEKWRHAESKAREIEREGRFEAAVAAEITRLRAEYANPAEDEKFDDEPATPTALVVTNGAANKGAALSAEGVHDFVLELRSAIKDERQLYHELLSEHEDLLALVAQQDIENASLTSALAGVGGKKAVDKALKEAESKAIKDFGTYIRLR